MDALRAKVRSALAYLSAPSAGAGDAGAGSSEEKAPLRCRAQTPPPRRPPRYESVPTRSYLSAQALSRDSKPEIAAWPMS